MAEALRMEDVPRIMDNANAELRRLHEENKLLHERHHDDNVEYTRVLAQRDALLEALKAAEPYLRHADVDYNVYVQCRAAIKAVEEGR
jgi:hypothetical protein